MTHHRLRHACEAAGRTSSFTLASMHPGAVKWRLEFQHMGSPAVRLLKPGGNDQPGGAFALCGRPGWRTRIYASPERDAIVRALQGTASKKLAIQLAGAGSWTQSIFFSVSEI